MCITPCYLDDGTEVACRYCWQCKENRVNDLVGRCIAESRYAEKTYAVTLTYAKEAGVNAVTLIYKDIQVFLKRLRRRYGKVRYICAGEYGTEKGRAHWHIGLFFYEKDPKPQNMPQLRFGEKLPPNEYRVDWEPWEHGFSYFQEPQFDGGDFRYLMKYAIKDQDLDSSDRKLSMSKKPPLGHHFMMDLAKRHVDEAVIPRSFKYKIAGVRKNNGKEKIFMMQGKTRENFMAAFKKGWIQKYGKEPFSEFFEQWDEKNYDYYYQEPIGWKIIKLNEKEISIPIFDETENLKRLHHKDVMYVQPWIDFNQTIDMGVLMEINYAGRDIVIHGKKNDNAIYEAGKWRSVDEINHFVEHGEIKRLELYEDVQRELIEKLQLQTDNGNN